MFRLWTEIIIRAANKAENGNGGSENEHQDYIVLVQLWVTYGLPLKDVIKKNLHREERNYGMDHSKMSIIFSCLGEHCDVDEWQDAKYATGIDNKEVSGPLNHSSLMKKKPAKCVHFTFKTTHCSVIDKYNNIIIYC